MAEVVEMGLGIANLLKKKGLYRDIEEESEPELDEEADKEYLFWLNANLSNIEEKFKSENRLI